MIHSIFWLYHDQNKMHQYQDPGAIYKNRLILPLTEK